MRTPPLLMAATLLFWGWLADFAVAALVMAAVVEGARLVRFRWEPTPRDMYRLADLCVVIILAMGVYRLAAGTGSMARWLPLGLFPLLAGQAYSTTAGVDLGAVLWTYRRREKVGAAADRRRVDISTSYFALALVAASAVNNRSPLFYLGTVVLISWALWGWQPRRSRTGFAALLLAAAVAGYGGAVGLNTLHNWIEVRLGYLPGAGQVGRNPLRQTTALGEIGQLKQSNHIVLRLWPRGGFSAGLLLHEASYTTFSRALWVSASTRFDPIPADPPPKGSWILGDGPSAGGRQLEIAMTLGKGRRLVPLPHGATRITALPADRLEGNAFGVVRAVNGPATPRYRVAYQPAAVGRQSQPAVADRRVPAAERAALQSFLAGLRPADDTPAALAAAIQAQFNDRFAYSLEQTAPPPGRSPLQHFLSTTRSGHCELFATATVLLLRESGIPARYATGFAASEFSRLEKCIVVRARHSHSWALAHIDGRWQPVDSTPEDWNAVETRKVGFFNPVLDLFRWVGFQTGRWWPRLWDAKWLQWLGWLGLPLLVLFWIRALRRRRPTVRQADPPKNTGPAPAERPASPFDALQTQLTLAVGPRRRWEPLAQWVERLADSRLGGEITGRLPELVQQHYRLRFHPDGLSPEEMAGLAGACEDLLRRLQEAGTAPSGG